MKKEHIPYKLNVAGDFYVEDGCCTACDVPQVEAPDHFAYDKSEGYDHCYICKQPKSEEEISNMIKAMTVQELDCIRYKGSDAPILEKMKLEGLAEYSDILEAYVPEAQGNESFLKKIIGVFK